MRRPTPDPVAPGQESVWDYPRPPRVEPTDEHVVVELGGGVVAETRRALRVLETSHPPVYYVPIEDVVDGALRPSARRTFCEFKGWAAYVDVVGADGRVAPDAGWTYPEPTPGFEVLAGTVAFYPGRMDRCHGRRRAGPRRAGRLLRWVGHRAGRWPVQGRGAGQRMVVTAPRT